MEVEFVNNKLEEQCTSIKAARRLFGGDNALATSLLGRINAIRSADTIKDIIVQQQFHFHKLLQIGNRDLRGYFAIDVKNHRDPWRIILQPLDENYNVYDPCNIDEIADSVRIVEIMEVSKHYE